MIESKSDSEQRLAPDAALDGDGSVIPSSRHPVIPSPLRAWLALVALSIRRQARMRQMVWIALGLLVLVVGLVALANAHNGWSMETWRYPRRYGPQFRELA